MKKSLSKWLQPNIRCLIIFYCIITFIPQPNLCQKENFNQIFLKVDKQNDENNLKLSRIEHLLLSNKNNTDSIITNSNVEISNSKSIEKIDNDNNEIMESLSPFSYLFLRTKRSTTFEHNGSLESEEQMYKKNFNILISRKLKSTEFIGLTGNIDELGNWDPDHAIELNRSDIITTGDNDEIWTTNIDIINKETKNPIEYRYFIGRKNIKNDKISIIEWENHVEPRKRIPSQDQNSNINSSLYGIDDVEIFGEINGDITTDFGWLQEHEKIIQFKFFRNPFNIKKSNLDQYRLKIIPYDSNDSESVENYLNNNSAIAIQPSSDVNVKFSKLKYNQSELKEQPTDGIIYNPDDILIYHIHLSNNLENINFLLKLYDMESSENSKLLGYQYIKSDDLQNSEGDLDLNLTTSNSQEETEEDDEQEKIGSVKLSYLIIKPLKISNFLFRTSFSNYWQSNWTALNVGHRGLGISFKLPENEKPPAIENTVISMKQAGIAGVDMVEFDVHLTKDLIPVIYHDFTILILNDTDKPPQYDNLIRVHLQDLTYDELKSIKMYYKQNDGNIIEYKAHNDETKIEHRLFPTLEDFFENIDTSIGFDVEIKWPQRQIDGNMEANQTLDKNLFADRILKTLLENGSGRLSFLSSFDADLCTMLKFKQNMYPVTFLTIGSINQWTSYYDPRCETVENAVANAKTWNLFGIVAHSKDYFNDPSLIKLSFDMNQKVFCWGNDINSVEAVEKMKEIGMTGVIYDRVDKFLIDNETSIFEDDDLKRLFKKQHL